MRGNDAIVCFVNQRRLHSVGPYLDLDLVGEEAELVECWIGVFGGVMFVFGQDEGLEFGCEAGQLRAFRDY